jgi:hypothetical protein
MRKVAILAALALFGGCAANQSERGVGLAEVSTDVGLGIEVLRKAAPPNIVVRRPSRAPQATPLPTLPPLVVTTPKPTVCPAAGDFDFPAQEAGVEPPENVRPREGSYRYYISGKVSGEGGPQTINEFETRTITDVVDDGAGEGAYRFTVQQTQLLDDRSGSGGILETTYLVVPRGNFQSVPNPPDPPGAGADAPNVADSGRGVFLASYVFRGLDEEGNPSESRFEPTRPLLLLPYPVVQGFEIDSRGSDPETGSQLHITGTVKEKMQIDACGDRVDSWLVDAQETFTISDPETLQTETLEADYNYGVGPQFGGMVLYERVEAPLDGPTVQVDSRIGEVPEPGTAG